MTEKLSNLPPQSYFDEQDALALLVPRAKVLAALADACGQAGAAVLSAQPAAPVLDDRWKARMLDGRAIERDEMGLGDHAELPLLDEGMMPRSFFAALGLELAHTSAEDQLDGDVLGAMSEAVNWTDWLPTPPHGDCWKLVSIFDTEDGPVAWWLRELPDAEDGTTTIRNLQAEVEKLKASAARARTAPAAPSWDNVRRGLTIMMVGFAHGPQPTLEAAEAALDAATERDMPLAGLRALAAAPQGEYPHLPPSVGDVTDFGEGKVDIDWGHPAPAGGTRLYSAEQMRAYVDADRAARAEQPAAVAEPANSEMDWDVLPENPGERARFDRQLTQLYGGDPRVFISTSLRLWAETRGGGFFGAQCAVFANEVAKMHIAPPTLQSPAAPAGVPRGWKLVPEEPTPEMLDAYVGADGRFHSGRADWAAMLAAAPQAPAAPDDAEMLAALRAVAVDVVHVGAGENTISDAARAKVEAVLEKIGAPWPSPAAAPAAPAVDAPIVWPKARDVGRIGDMSPSAHLRIGLDSDNDVWASIWDERGGATIEFCTPGAGGGKSSRTRMALLAVMVAMEADNAADPRRDWWAERNGEAQAQQKGL